MIMCEKVIDVQNISKKFGKSSALQDVSFSISKGEIFGFLGPSGSGKTTMINILTGQLHSDSGNSTIMGKKSDTLSSKQLKQIGLVSDTGGFYEKMTLYNNLIFYSKFYGVERYRVDDLLKKVGLYDSRNKISEKLSTGMKQRMFLVRALIIQPRVLFLVEPTSGLDTTTSQTIHELIIDLKESGVTIFLTTHDMNEATLLCDNLALLSKGELVEIGKPSELIQKYNVDKKVRITYIGGTQQNISFSELESILVNDIDKIVAIHSCEPTLEDIFITLTGGKLDV